MCKLDVKWFMPMKNNDPIANLPFYQQTDVTGVFYYFLSLLSGGCGAWGAYSGWTVTTCVRSASACRHIHRWDITWYIFIFSRVYYTLASSLTHSLVRSFVRSFVRPIIRLFIPLLAHPAFRPRWAYKCHRVASIVCPQFTRNASSSIPIWFCLVCLKELVPVHKTSSRISESVIIN